jgi:NADPH2:quinone reductase
MEMAERIEGKMTDVSTMRALVFAQYNLPFCLTEIARPRPPAGQVLMRIKASGVNPLDPKIRTGNGDNAKQPLTAVLGMDMAGVVDEVGAGLPDSHAGDEVYG